MATHRLIVSWGATGRIWSCDSEQAAREILTGLFQRGFEHRSPGGNLTIIPPWRFTKIEIKPIRQRGRRRASDVSTELQRAVRS